MVSFSKLSFTLAKLIWTSTCLYFLVSQSYVILTAYSRNPYASKCRMHLERRMDFPKIRICPSDWVDRHSQDRMNISDHLLEFMLEVFVIGDLYKREYSSKRLSSLQDELDIFYRENQLSPTDYPSMVLKQLTQPCEKMFAACGWMKRGFNCCDSAYGRDMWGNSGYCRDFGAQEKFDAMRSLKAYLGVEITSHDELRTRKSFVANRALINGVVVGWTDSLSPFLPDPHSLRPNTVTDMRLSLTRVKSIHDCILKYKEEDVFKPITTQSECVYSCYVKTAARRCQCYPFGVGVQLGTNDSFCQPVQYATCYKTNVSLSITQIFSKCEKTDRCKSSCDMVYYQPFYSSGEISDELVEEVASLMTRVTSLNFSGWRSFISSYVATSGVTTFEEIETQTPNTIVSNIGGLLGLWLGTSVYGLGILIFRLAMQSSIVKKCLDCSVFKTKATFPINRGIQLVEPKRARRQSGFKLRRYINEYQT